MSAIARPMMPALSTLLRLGRISNLPTVWTNVIAGSVIAGGASPDQLALIVSAMTAFYVGGMYLNDFFDRAVDARERPGRPIAAGEITAAAVSYIGFGLLAAGVLLMIPLGPTAAACGLVLAATIVLYDVWHKGNALSPIVMGLCRAMVYIGACVAVTGSLSKAALIGAFALAFHVAGITYAAKQEGLNRIGNLWPLLMLAVPLLAALPSHRMARAGCPDLTAGGGRECHTSAGNEAGAGSGAACGVRIDSGDLPGRRRRCRSGRRQYRNRGVLRARLSRDETVSKESFPGHEAGSCLIRFAGTG